MPCSEENNPIIYQVFTRLFGNKNRVNKPWGRIKENGVGKFADFDDTALSAIKRYGVTYIWYTGVPHHALIGDYEGLSADHPEVVKGRAGSPYAVKDYYNVNPDLAVDPQQRLQEFEQLIARTHAHGMKVIIDIVPNHVARCYQSQTLPAGVSDFGADDDTAVSYHRDNNFYYIPGKDFIRPDYPDGFSPLGGEHDLSLPSFVESPAKWTGNGARSAKPLWDDWFETVKINYGITPDGTKEFASLPADYAEKGIQAHVDFWAQQRIPDSWKKFREIALYWLEKGVDGFRFDMAEMVPVEFWSYLNSAIKSKNPQALTIAEVYQPHLYRPYIKLGKMDYLYDKVDLYDSLKAVIQCRAGTSVIDVDQAKLQDIDAHLLRFLENHDEQRIASSAFAGDPFKAWPAMVVTTLLGKGATLLYFGQAQGEAAQEDMGFGRSSRTTIFDYAGVPAHQAWMNGGLFDGGQLSAEQKQLDTAYQRLLAFAANEPSLQGEFINLHSANRQQASSYDERCYAFARRYQGHRLIVVVNFSAEIKQFELVIPENAAQQLSVQQGQILHEQLNSEPHQACLTAKKGDLSLTISCEAYGAQVFKWDND